MFGYFVKRFLISLPTLIGITVICFVLVHLTPGGPVEQAIAQWRSASVGGEVSSSQVFDITDEQRQMLNELYGFDKPIVVRYFEWLYKLIQLDFGESYYYEEPVSKIIYERLPVSITFGIVSFFLTYLICIPLGVLKALKHGTPFDSISSALVFVGYSIPNFAFAILLVILFCGGSFWNIFPIEGFTSENFSELGFFGQMMDILHHMFLPLLAYVIGNFAALTMLMKNSLLEQINQDYIRTARAKGLSETTVVLKHALRNALLPIASGIGGWLGLFLSGSVLIETIFSLQGIGRLSYESILHRDYPVVLAIIVVGSILQILGNILSDYLYVIIDPRIDFK